MTRHLRLTTTAFTPSRSCESPPCSRFYRRRGKDFQRAIGAFGFAGDAQAAAVPDDLVREQDPFLPRDYLHQVLLDFLGIVLRGEFKATGDAVHMGVDDYAYGFVEPRAQHNVRRLAGDAGEGEEFLHVVGNLAAEVGEDFFRGTDD